MSEEMMLVRKRRVEQLRNLSRQRKLEGKTLMASTDKVMKQSGQYSLFFGETIEYILSELEILEDKKDETVFVGIGNSNSGVSVSSVPGSICK